MPLRVFFSEKQDLQSSRVVNQCLGKIFRVGSYRGPNAGHRPVHPAAMAARLSQYLISSSPKVEIHLTGQNVLLVHGLL